MYSIKYIPMYMDLSCTYSTNIRVCMHILVCKFKFLWVYKRLFDKCVYINVGDDERTHQYSVRSELANDCMCY